MALGVPILKHFRVLYSYTVTCRPKVEVGNAYLSYYAVAVNQWITSCHKNRTTTRALAF